MNKHDFYKLDCKQSCLCEGTTFVFTKWCAGKGGGGRFTESHVHHCIKAGASGIAKHDVQRFLVILRFAFTSSSHDLN